jgi:Flp pilus assembly protein CpaB
MASGTTAMPSVEQQSSTAHGRARRIGNRLPTGRAVVGACLIVVAASGVLIAHRSASRPALDRYVVAVRSVDAGAMLQADDLGTVAIDLPSGVVAVHADDATELIGRVATHPIRADELLRPSDTFDAGRFSDPETIEVALDLPAANALQGVISAGSVVDVLRTDPDRASTQLLASGVRVSAVDGGTEDAIGADGSTRVLLAVAGPEAATALVDGARRAELTLVLPRPRSAQDG